MPRYREKFRNSIAKTCMKTILDLIARSGHCLLASLLPDTDSNLDTTEVIYRKIVATTATYTRLLHIFQLLRVLGAVPQSGKMLLGFSFPVKNWKIPSKFSAADRSVKWWLWQKLLLSHGS